MKLQVTTWLEPTLNHLWKIRKQIIKDEEDCKAHLGDVFGFCFGYPEYAGLSEKIYNKIPSNMVDIIEKQTYYILANKAQTKKDFFVEMLKILTKDTIKVT